MSVSFQDDYIKVDADAAVSWIDLEFRNAHHLDNDKTTDKELTGTSTSVTVHYQGNNPRPRTFQAQNSPPVTFPDAATIRITGGGVEENIVYAADGAKHKAHWILNGA